MKRNILLLSGLLFTLIVQAAVTKTKQVVHDTTIYLDPYTCTADFVVKTTLPKSQYDHTAYYYRYEETAFENDKDSVNLHFDSRDYACVIVAAGPQKINAPGRTMAAEGELPPEDLPWPDHINVMQWDVYYIYVQHPYVEHWDTLYTDIYRGDAEFGLYSTLGVAPYCGNPGDIDRCEIFNESQKSIAQKESEDMPYQLNLYAGDYTYYVNAGPQAINSPERKINLPSSMSVNEVWTDIFYLHVIESECNDNLTYAKWNDVMFIDNGGNSGDFERGEFVAYQWYHEGEAIEDATAQWYRAPGEAPEGLYYAKITTKDGKVVYTCPAEFSDLPRSEEANPHSESKSTIQKRLVNGQLVIDRNGVMYDAQGARL